MFKWIWRITVLAVLGFVGYVAYDLHRGGFFEMPELSADEYPLSFKNGFRAIVQMPAESGQSPSGPKLFRRIEHATPSRRYLSVPKAVPAWLKDKWSTCDAKRDLSEDWREIETYIENSLPEPTLSNLRGARLEAVCGFDLDDGSFVTRGLLYSVPKL